MHHGRKYDRTLALISSKHGDFTVIDLDYWDEKNGNARMSCVYSKCCHHAKIWTSQFKNYHSCKKCHPAVKVGCQKNRSTDEYKRLYYQWLHISKQGSDFTTLDNLLDFIVSLLPDFSPTTNLSFKKKQRCQQWTRKNTIIRTLDANNKVTGTYGAHKIEENTCTEESVS